MRSFSIVLIVQVTLLAFNFFTSAHSFFLNRFLHKTLGIQQPIKYPVILVPGNGGSQLYAQLNKPEVVHYFCERKTDDYFNLWLNLELLVPFVIDCWVDNMRLVYNQSDRTTSNSPGVNVKTIGFGDTSSIEYIDPNRMSITGYFNVLVEALVDMGYTRGHSLRGAPYDFRKSPQELTEFFTDFDSLVLDTYEKNEQQPAVLVCHSMGCPMMLYYLHRKSPEWKARYIRTLVTMGAPWGGAMKAVKAFVTGDNLGVIVIPALTIRNDEKTYPSLAFLLPSRRFWNSDNEVLVRKGDRNYTINDYEQLFDDISDPVGYNMYLDTKDLLGDFSPPEVEVHCLHGFNIETIEQLHYKTKFTDWPEITYGDGDGTVNTRSLQGCLRWQQQQQQPVYYRNFSKVEHMSTISNKDVVRYVVDLISNL